MPEAKNEIRADRGNIYSPQVAKNSENRIFRQLDNFFKNTFPNLFQQNLDRNASLQSKFHHIDEKNWEFVHSEENEPT